MDENKETLDILFDVVYQSCRYTEDNMVWSNGITCYAEAIRLLARHGLAEIIDERHRMVIARLVERD